MKQTKLSLAFAAVTALMLAACADQTDFTQADLRNQAEISQESPIQFGTYLGKNATTRAYGDGTYEGGGITNIGKGENPLSSAEFGVFAYHTGNKIWSAWTQTAPNFMYNQEIKYGGPNWYYDPVKYWPNGIDLANTANNPSNTATEEGTQYLSFFAYAPYHTLTETAYSTSDTSIGGDLPTSPAVTTAITTGEAFGIVAMSKNDETTDMQVKYILNNAQEDEAVDLLWGLRGQTTYKETDAVHNTVDKLGTVYNTDLTKQTVDEKVKFLFKHALARIGGSTKSTSSSSGTSQICGLKVVLDVDDNSDNPGIGADNQNAYLNSDFDNAKTLVTIQSVNIRDKYTYSHEATSTIAETTSDFLTDGWFDVMTGTWTKTEKVLSHTTSSNGAIYSVNADNEATGYNLNKDIKEPSGNDVSDIIKSDYTEWEPTGDEPTGVTTGTPKNVYADEDIPGLLLIPGENAGGNTIYVTVDYFVRTADPNLNAHYTTVRQIITNKVELTGTDLNPNQYYTLVMHLGLTSVKFEAKVADWSAGVNEEYNEDGTEVNPGTENDKTIWLPSNVVSTTVTTSSENIFAKGSPDKEIRIAKDGTGAIFDITDLTVGNTYEITGLASPATYAVIAGGNDNTKVLTSTTLSLNVSGLKTNAGSLSDKETTVTITEKNSSSATVSTTVVKIIQAADETELTASATKTNVEAAGETITLTIQQTTGSVDKKSEATVSVIDKETGAAAVGVTVASGNESITFPANNSSKEKTYVATITVDDVTKTITFTQAAHAVTLSASPATGLSATMGAGSEVTLTVSDGTGSINLASSENTSTITVTKPTDTDVTASCTITKTATGAKIVLPTNSTNAAITYTITVQVNNAAEATTTVTQVAGE